METITKGDRKLKTLPLTVTELDSTSYVELHNTSGEKIAIGYTDFIAALSSVFLVASDTRLYYGTSTTTLTINGGSQVLTTQAGLGYTVGQRVRASYSATRYMEGYITAYSGTTLTFTCDYKAGTGSYDAWVLSPTTEQIVPEGGSTGQVLGKASGTSYDVEWVNVSSGSLSGSDAVIDCGDRMTGNEVFDCGMRV